MDECITEHEVALRIRMALQNGNWAKAQSELEFGIASLVQGRASRSIDNLPVSQIGLSVRTYLALDRAEIETVGQLKKALKQGIVKAIVGLGPAADRECRLAMKNVATRVENIFA